ncbi:MAG: MFS transporter [Burkholderiaceae bacterium]
MDRLSARGLFSYALLAVPLAMMALPGYVLVPKFYAEAGLSLTLVGTVLLGTRLLDAVVDPVLGVWIDRVRRRSPLWPLAVALPFAAFGFVLLFNPPTAMEISTTTAWLGGSLIAAMFGYSLASIAYQAWGAALASDDANRTRVTTWREGAGLIGVIVASLVPYTLGIQSLAMVFLLSLAAAMTLMVLWSPRPARNDSAATRGAWHSVALPLRSTSFRWLLSVFVLNGIAAAIPASLVLFFVADRLQLEAQSGLFLGLYFAAGALSMSLWAKLAKSWPLPKVWLAGMIASIAAFVGSYWLGAGDFAAFAFICALSGAALGADLALPPALLARVIDANGHQGAHEGAYFGLWNFVNKLNLALAAGIALPTLALLGYAPGARDPGALNALAVAYALLPCLLKLAAAALLVAASRGGRF